MSKQMQYSICIIFTLSFFINLSDVTASQNVIKTQNISINKKTKEIKIFSSLAIQQGILEYLLVGDHGKAYESVFKVSENKPSELNFALLLIGCVPLEYETFLEIKQKKNGFDELLRHHKKSLLQISIARNKKKLGFIDY